MAKMRNWSKGLKDGNRPMGDSDIITLKHIKYQPIEDKVVASKPISTTLSSLYLGGQHKMSSGAENIFFTNLTSEIAWYPTWGGVKRQNIPENRGPSGLILPTSRIYSPELIEVASTGSELMPYVWQESGSITTSVTNISAHGIRIRPKDNIDTNTRLRFTVKAEGPEGISIYEHEFKMEGSHKGGDLVDVWFDHPLDIRKGLVTWAGLSKETYSNSNEYEPMIVSSSVINKDYVILFYRGFEDELITLESDLGKSEYALASMHDYNIADSLHLKDCQVLTMDDGVTLLFNT